MRIPLATGIESRDGSIAKDARIVNGFIDENDVFKRPAVNSALATASGQAQGSIFNVNGLVYVINADIVKSYNAAFANIQTITL